MRLNTNFLCAASLRRRALRVEEQQPMQVQAGRHPGQREHQQVAGHQERQDRRQRQHQPLVEVALAGIPRHVVARIGGHHGAHQGHQCQHDHRHGVDEDADGEVAEAERQRDSDEIQRLGAAEAGPGRVAHEGDDGEREGAPGHNGGELRHGCAVAVRGSAGHAAQEPQDHGCRQRGGGACGEGGRGHGLLLVKAPDGGASEANISTPVT
jgi:hypothetical protein